MSFEKQKFKMFFTVKLTVFANYTKYLMRDLTDVSEEYEGGK